MGDGRGQPTSSGLYLHIHQPLPPPPHWLAVLVSPHCPQCLRLLRLLWLRSWVCQIVPCPEKRWEASLTQPQAPGLPGEEAGKPKSLPDHGSVPKAGKGWAAAAPWMVNPTWLKSLGLDLPKGIFSVSNTLSSVYLAQVLFWMTMECLL